MCVCACVGKLYLEKTSQNIDLIFSSTCRRPASYCHGIVSVVCPFTRPCVGVCVLKLLLQKTSSQKLLTGFLRNLTGMFLRWSSFNSFKQLCSMKNSGCHGNQSKKPLKIFSSQTTYWIALLFFRNVP